MKHFDARDLDEILRKVHVIKPNQRAYIQGMLMGKNTYGGVSERELKNALRELKTNHSDDISHLEAQRIHDAIHEHLNPEVEDDGDDSTDESGHEKKRHTSWF